MTKDEALRMALEALEGADQIDCDMQAAITAIKKALAQPKQEPVGKLQKPTAERAWFTIAEFNAWADKKLSENPHWVMPTEEPEREWVGLTKEEIAEFDTWHDNREEEIGWVNPSEIVAYIEAKLRSKNT